MWLIFSSGNYALSPVNLSIPFADMTHFRIPGTQWMGNQIIALGMLYYKMKDRFV